MKIYYVIFILLISTAFYGQNGSISGSVVDEANGNAMPGVNILIRSIKFSTTTDSDGKYVFRNVKAGVYEVEFSFFGYRSKAISEVIAKNNEITYLNTNLAEVKNELKEVVITKVKAKTESIKSLLIAQKNSITVSDGISAETMKRTPDKTTSDVLKRVSGVSIQDNKFVVIRGLNDRYNFAALNGAPLPSSESDRKAFSFDIFPSNMLDNLVITKTASPDMPGDFAGGVISINTKAVPDKNFQSFSYGSGYNTITTFKDQKDYKGGSTDWLGFDDGTRALPSTIPSKEAFGISPDLAVQQAGLNGTVGAAEVAKTFDTDMSLQDKKFSPNSSFQYAIGHHFDFGEKVVGIVFSLSHSLTNNFNQTTRNEWNNGTVGATSILQKSFDDKNYSQQVLTGSLANFSLKLNQNHSFTFKNIFSINSNDLVVDRSGKDDVDDVRILASTVRWFTSNKIYSGQLNGEHYFPQQKIKINWGGFFSDIQRSIPNLRRNLYLIADPSSSNPKLSAPRAVIIGQGGGADFGGGIFYSESSESLAGGKLDLSHKFNIGDHLQNEIKIGSTIQMRQRDFFARQLNYNQSKAPYDNSFELLPDALIFSRENMGLQSSGKNGFTLIDNSAPTDEYTAGSDIFASYFMVDNRYKKFRLIWGVRAESFNQKFFSLIVSTDEYPKGEVNINTTKLDFLPSANLIYAINSKQNLRLSYSKTVNRPEFRELAPFLFYDFSNRFNTQGNPNLKRASILNFDLRYEIFPSKGQLFTVSYFNKNFDSPIEVIQQDTGTPTISYINANKAKLSGVELEFRVLLSSIFKNENTTLFDDFTLFSNIAVIKSEADVTGIKGTNPDEARRPLQGQSPYVLNSGLQYMNKDNGLILSANVNRSGNRYYIVGSKEKDGIWEKGRTFLDMQVAKSFFKNKLEFKLNIQNILAQDLIFYQNNYRNTVKYGSLETLANHVFTGDFHYQDGYNTADDDDIWRTKFGRSFSLTATYNF